MNKLNYKHISPNEWYAHFKLSDDIVSYFWNLIENEKQYNTNHGPSLTLKDPDNVITNKIFPELFYSDIQPLIQKRVINCFSNVYSGCVNNSYPILSGLWANFQKKYEFIPLHNHCGMFSFVIWMKIPYEWENEKNLPWIQGSATNKNEIHKYDFRPNVGNFCFVSKDFSHYTFTMNSELEGNMVFFPSDFYHQVYPFYTSEEDRISISGNIYFKSEEE